MMGGKEACDGSNGGYCHAATYGNAWNLVTGVYDIFTFIGTTDYCGRNAGDEGVPIAAADGYD
jgi:hypothetical protein